MAGMVSYLFRKPLGHVLVVLLSSWVILGCHAFKGKTQISKAEVRVLSSPPFEKAGGADDSALSFLQEVPAVLPPAVIRPDPDVFVRRLLRQFRAEGSLVAQEIGRVEAFRLLLGGASEDFRTPPQETYDATSLLASQKVAEEICEGLVAPDSGRHPGWASILPEPPADVAGNVKFLAQRFLALPSSRIAPEVIAALKELVLSEGNQGAQYASYIPACVALSTDAEALFL